MKIFCGIVCALVVVVASEEYYKDLPLFRQRRQVFTHGEHQVGQNGKVFGTLGQSDAGLYGQAGYHHNIFNDHRGHLEGQVHGTRVLGPQGGTSHLGGDLKWQGDHANAGLGVSRQIHGGTNLRAEAGGRWPVGKNGEAYVNGQYGTNFHGRPDVGIVGGYKHRF